MSMALEFKIVGGRLRIDRKVFAKEMLMGTSLLKTITGRQSAEASAGRSKVILQDEGDYIVVDYSGGTPVSLGQSPGDMLKDLKARYTKGIKGRVTCKGSMYTFEVDLDNDSDQVTFLME